MSLVFPFFQKNIQKRVSIKETKNTKPPSLDLYFFLKGYYTGLYRTKKVGKLSITNISFTLLEVFNQKTNIQIEKSCIICFPIDNQCNEEIYLKARRNEDLPEIPVLINQIKNIPYGFFEIEKEPLNSLSAIFKAYYRHNKTTFINFRENFAKNLLNISDFLKKEIYLENVSKNSRKFTNSFMTRKSPMDIYITNNQMFLILNGFPLLTPKSLLKIKRLENNIEKLINQIHKLQ